MEKVKIWIYAEVKDNRPASVYYELLSKAAEETRGVEHAEICALVAGDSLNPVIDLLKQSGADKIYAADDERLKDYNCQNYSEVIVKAAETYTPDIFLFGATGRGAEIAPTVAAKLKTGLAAHGVDISIGADGTLGTSVPAFGGKVVSEILTPTHKPQMASVRPGILDNKSLSAKEHVELISLDTDILSHINSTETFVSFEPNTENGDSLEEAKIVVCAGRGVMTDEAWQDLQRLAKVLNASIGYTRSFLDNGFLQDESGMIGASGISVKPDLYIGFGVSGATHHVCGINKAKYIISVNKDPQAKMFRYSDVGAVSDADKMIKLLIEQFEA